MFFETFLILVAVAAILIFWGLKEKNTGIAGTGCAMIIVVGMMLWVTGLTTSNVSSLETIKYIAADGNQTYKTNVTFQFNTIAQDYGLWAASFLMMISGTVGILASYKLIQKK